MLKTEDIIRLKKIRTNFLLLSDIYYREESIEKQNAKDYIHGNCTPEIATKLSRNKFGIKLI